MEGLIDSLEDYLSTMNDQFYKLKNSFEKIMILSKINELVFWLEMYKEKNKPKRLVKKIISFLELSVTRLSN